MFRKLLKNKKAQNTAEYALLISLVVAAIIAMQTYAQRTLQSRIRDASQYLMNKTNALGTAVQYEPYYLESSYNVVRDDKTTELLANKLIRMEVTSNRTRAKGGFQRSEFNTRALYNKI